MKPTLLLPLAAAGALLASTPALAADCDGFASRTGNGYCCYIPPMLGGPSYQEFSARQKESCPDYGGTLLSATEFDAAAIAFFKGHEQNIAPATATVKGHACKYNPVIKRHDLPFSLFRPYEPGATAISSADYTKLVYKGAGQQALVASAERAGKPVLVKAFTSVLGEEHAFHGSDPSNNKPYAAYDNLKKEVAVQDMTADPLLRLATINHWFVDVVDTHWVDLLNANRSSRWTDAVRKELVVADNAECPLSLFLEMTDYKGGDLSKAMGAGKGVNKLAALQPAKRLEVSYRLLHDLLTGVYSLQAMGLAHLDIKPDNVFLTNTDINVTNAVLGDYGQARNFGTDGKARDTLYFSFNSPRWASPEAMAGSHYIDYKKKLKAKVQSGSTKATADKAIDDAGTLSALITVNDTYHLGLKAELLAAPSLHYWHGDKGTVIDTNDVYSAGIIFAQMLLAGSFPALDDVDNPKVYTTHNDAIAASSLAAIAAAIGIKYGKPAQQLFEGLTHARDTRLTVHDALRDLGAIVHFTEYRARFLARLRATVKAAKNGAIQANMSQRILIGQELDKILGDIESIPCMKADTRDYASFRACVSENLFSFTRLSWALVDGGQHGNYAKPWGDDDRGPIEEGFKEEKIRGPYVGFVYEAKAYHYDAALDAMSAAAAHQRLEDQFGIKAAAVGKGVKVAVLDQWPTAYTKVTDAGAVKANEVVVVPGTNRGENHDSHGHEVTQVLKSVAPGVTSIPFSFKVSEDAETKALLEYLRDHDFDVINSSQTLSLEKPLSAPVAKQLIYEKDVFISKSAGNGGKNLTTTTSEAKCTDLEGKATFQNYPKDDLEKGTLWFLLCANNDLKTAYHCSNVPGTNEAIWKRSFAIPATVVNVGTAQSHVYETGTSFSAPYFSGLAAMLLHFAVEDAAARHVTITRTALRTLVNTAIKQSARRAPEAKPEELGRGVPDAVAAMNHIAKELLALKCKATGCYVGEVDALVNEGMFRLKVSEADWKTMGALLKAKGKVTGKVDGVSGATFAIRETGGTGIAIGLAPVRDGVDYVKARRMVERRIKGWIGKTVELTPQR